jgi:hypothetical protein
MADDLMISAAALSRLGSLRMSFATEPASGELKGDGETEYDRADYSAFIDKFDGTSLVLAGSTSDKFKIMDLRNLVFVAAGTDYTLLAKVGAKDFTMTTGHMPAHTHTYDKAKKGATTPAVTIGLNLLSVPTDVAYDNVATGSAGSATPTPIVLMPRAVGINVFVFAGRKRW